MRAPLGLLWLVAMAVSGCRGGSSPDSQAGSAPIASPSAAPVPAAPGSSPLSAAGSFRGFDRNDYPGDDAMRSLHNPPASFAFTGFWITPPPGENTNSWTGKRDILRAQGWGFLVLANGRLDTEILKAQHSGTAPAALGRKDADSAVADAQHEGFRPGTTLFLDQEEGGRLLPEQATYLLAWTEAVAASGYRPGVYASGQQVSDGPGAKIDTIEDIRARVVAGKLHPVAIFDALDQCPPAPGCTTAPKAMSLTPDPDIDVWQYAQSPRRPEITKSCAVTYAADGNCYAPGAPGLFLDLNVARSADPSNGR